jgi:hypothetical protein
MKTAIIFVLLLALGAAAYFTKPSEAMFQQYLIAQSTQGDNGVLQAGWDQFQAERYLKHCTFNDHVLWVDVQTDGRTAYSGAFNHWFSRAKVAGDVNNMKQQISGVQIDKK